MVINFLAAESAHKVGSAKANRGNSPICSGRQHVRMSSSLSIDLKQGIQHPLSSSFCPEMIRQIFIRGNPAVTGSSIIPA